ncbi:transglycosylase domain-containing protein [Sphingomonas gilva]|nr:transglycosylase domain-containing protein [Sphingomonas gilva]
MIDPFPDELRRAAPDLTSAPAYADGLPPAPPAKPRTSKWRWFMRGVAALIVLFVLAVAWLAVTAPLSKSLEPIAPPSVTLLASDGTPIARHGAIIGPPVDVAKLPAHVPEAFMAIEDRRFRTHWGVDPRGIVRAAWNNARAGGVVEGGSTITQQLAKLAFLSSDRTTGRKAREALIAFWLEAWLTKDEILSRYLSAAYFGDNVYGLSAAAKHYFSKAPEDLTIAQAAMLAGLVKAPSRLAPTSNLEGARERQALVVGAMADAGFLSEAEAEAVRPARLKVNRTDQLPTGTYFADWVMPMAREAAGPAYGDTRVATTLDRDLQRLAVRVVNRAGLNKAQVALVAMRPDGTVVAMLGGKDYKKSPFNRATQAKRQPGSTFKLFVYLAALRAGKTPEDMIADEPITIADWSPKNDGGVYRGEISLRRAFSASSNVAAAQLTNEVGPAAVARAARDLGVTTPIGSDATIALGTSEMTLIELTAAYAAVAAGQYPVRAHGLPPQDRSLWQRLRDPDRSMGAEVQEDMKTFLRAAVDRGTAHEARLPVPAYGKTGTTQDYRDALFVGFAGDLVVGVWVGNDDNSPNPGLAGGTVPARIWRDFMTGALDLAPARAAPREEPEVELEDDPANLFVIGNDSIRIETDLEGLNLNLGIGPNGFDVQAEPDAPPTAPPAPQPPPGG